ncbi:hypothetical protein DX933_06725 [Ornithinibacillus gellani]|uniref:YrvL family regulatory protein n=1 Tax=Ornithinibacillus gellani TaxID=2293253 RepID=UPI000F47A56B|nr:YrvL family regulatory protein [Ornithinibacillus gellani]TQS75398.1 hypothetical protein DX933_06725 [Ornithinibacillus gellani]
MGKKSPSDSLGWAGKAFVFFLLGLLVLAALGFLFGLFYFGFAGLFRLLGVTYNSMGTLFVFVLAYFIISLFTDILAKGLAYVAGKQVTGKSGAIIMHFIVITSMNLLVLSIIDSVMTGIQITFFAKVIIAFLLFMLDVVFDDDKKKQRHHKGKTNEKT